MNRLPFDATPAGRLFSISVAWPALQASTGWATICRVIPHAAILISVELCSLTLKKQDLSVANIIASGLFGERLRPYGRR